MIEQTIKGMSVDETATFFVALVLLIFGLIVYIKTYLDLKKQREYFEKRRKEIEEQERKRNEDYYIGSRIHTQIKFDDKAKLARKFLEADRKENKENLKYVQQLVDRRNQVKWLNGKIPSNTKERTASKKKVTINFFRFCVDPTPKWFDEAIEKGKVKIAVNHNKEFDTVEIKSLINTLEGKMEAKDGDIIIEGVNGEIYPCKKDIFYKTYDIHYKGIIDYSETYQTISNIKQQDKRIKLDVSDKKK